MGRLSGSTSAEPYPPPTLDCDEQSATSQLRCEVLSVGGVPKLSGGLHQIPSSYQKIDELEIVLQGLMDKILVQRLADRVERTEDGAA
jgi:hypothetical protein